jgi:hypothetical protein
MTDFDFEAAEAAANKKLSRLKIMGCLSHIAEQAHYLCEKFINKCPINPSNLKQK